MKSTKNNFLSIWIIFFSTLVTSAFGQVAVDVAGPSSANVPDGSLPKTEISEPKDRHSNHLFYFQDTLESVLLKYTNSPDFNPKDPSSLNDLGYIYAYFGEYDEAIIQYKKAIDLNPEFSDAYLNWGVAEYKSGRRDKAQVLLEKSYQMDASKGESAYDLGLVAFEEKEYARSAGFFEEAAKTLTQDTKGL